MGMLKDRKLRKLAKGTGAMGASTKTSASAASITNTARNELVADGTASGAANESAPAVKKSTLLVVLAAMGPGIITAMAGNDAGGIATYSQVGALFGYKTLWALPIMCVLLIVVQITAGRMGAVTGKGFAALIRERFGIRLTAIAMVCLLIGNIATIISQFAGIASGMEMFGVSKYVTVPVAALAVWALVVGGNYKRVERVFLVLSLVFVTYIVAAIMAGPNWEQALSSTFVPQVVNDPEYVSLMIAMVGTTIAPWMIFYLQSNLVEKGMTMDDSLSMKVDAISGTVVACVIAWFIVVTTATVLFPEGIRIETAADAAMALEPFAGPYARMLFAIGLIGASFLAACVLPLTTSFVICEAFGWEAGVSFTWKEAPIFKGILTFVTFLSAVVVLIPGINLMAMMLFSQFVCGVILPVLLVLMAIIASDKHVMRGKTVGPVSRVLIWVTVAIVTLLTVALMVMNLLGMG
ncbi:Nramp family divalent metal transporter [Adlercreutzia sp. ZJ141]|uniref:Nramp family divalent metal transporter n=1 Tax=Adlercreutzia sp. ZJ141 TaxID=2709406 RepID=UPI001F15303C|nr:Nramp family divalent metal transporter [Adlercreutzia sp. ZJ141]